MAFKVKKQERSESISNLPTVDWDAYHNYIVEKAGLQSQEVLIGYVAGIIDLGEQVQEDAKVVFTGSAADEAKAIAQHPATYFEDGIDQQTKKPARFKRWPQKPLQAVTLAIDFPDIMLNLGQFFGEENSEEKPLRMYLGGQFYIPGKGMVVGRPIYLKYSNLSDDKKKPIWSFDKKHTLYKMAVGAKIIENGKPFLPDDIDQLLGVSLQFDVQIFFKENKGKKYFTENIKFASGLGRNQKAIEPLSDPFLIQFDDENEHLSEVRSHVLNTIRQASNFEGSKIQKQLDAIRPANKDEHEEEDKPKDNPKPAGKRVAEVSQKVEDPEDDPFASDSCPF